MKMAGKIYDPNMLRVFKTSEETDWYEVTSENFDIYGLFTEGEGCLSRRMPLDIAKTVSEGVFNQAIYGAGGRILFSTDSPFVSIRAEYGEGRVPTVCNHVVSFGFDLYEFDGKRDKFFAAYRQVEDFDG